MLRICFICCDPDVGSIRRVAVRVVFATAVDGHSGFLLPADLSVEKKTRLDETRLDYMWTIYSTHAGPKVHALSVAPEEGWGDFCCLTCCVT